MSSADVDQVSANEGVPSGNHIKLLSTGDVSYKLFITIYCIRRNFKYVEVTVTLSKSTLLASKFEFPQI